jgi:putative tricarboxylic transport membrane protein
MDSQNPNLTEDPDAGKPPHSGSLPLVCSTRTGAVVVASLLAIVGALFAWQSSLLDLGRVGLPGPGFFPLVLALSVIALAGAIAYEHWHGSSRTEIIGLFHRDVVIVMAASLAVPLVFEWLGALLTIGLFAVVVLVLLAHVRLVVAVAASAVFVAGCWFMFQVLLGLQLPMGLLGESF